MLRDSPRPHLVSPGAIPASSQVPGPTDGAAAVCSAASVQSVSPAPVRHGTRRGLPQSPVPGSGFPSGSGMAEFGRQRRTGGNG